MAKIKPRRPRYGGNKNRVGSLWRKPICYGGYFRSGSFFMAIIHFVMAEKLAGSDPAGGSNQRRPLRYFKSSRCSTRADRARWATEIGWRFSPSKYSFTGSSTISKNLYK